jgi:broad specificity phosphatase PhoE
VLALVLITPYKDEAWDVIGGLSMQLFRCNHWGYLTYIANEDVEKQYLKNGKYKYCDSDADKNDYSWFVKANYTFASNWNVFADLQMRCVNYTTDGVNRIMQGQTPGRLTDNGVEQARLLGKQLAHKHIDAFVSSDLKRAVDTCIEIAAPHFNGDKDKALAAIDQTKLLRERDWGSFTGRFIPDLKDAKWTDDIESQDDMLQRAAKFIDYIRRNYDGKTVAAVGHGIINKAIQAVFYGKEMRDIKKMDNAEIRRLSL